MVRTKLLFISVILLSLPLSSCWRERTVDPPNERASIDQPADLSPQHDPINSNTREKEMSNGISFQTLGGYLHYMSRELDCYFTFEDAPNPITGGFPWIVSIREFESDVEILTIDDLVTHLDEDLEGVKVVRSTKNPSVVHVIAESLLEESYVMDETVTIEEYSGTVGTLPEYLGTLLDGKIATKTMFSMPALEKIDTSTEVEVDVEDETVRDILTGAVSLEHYNWEVWRAGRYQTGNSTIFVRYLGPKWTFEDTIENEGLEAYLEEMGKRLDCYFTFEDEDGSGIDDWDRSWILLMGESVDCDLDVPTIDALAAKLDAELNRNLEGSDRVEVIRSTRYPSVVHLIRKSLLVAGYVMEDEVSGQYEGDLFWLPKFLGTLLNQRIDTPDSRISPGFFAGVTPIVEVDVENKTVRDVLTGAALLEPSHPFLWNSGRFVNGQEKVLVDFMGDNDE